jgi:hypothetical protein
MKKYAIKLLAIFERVQQRDGADRTEQRDSGVHFHDRQPSTGHGDRVALARVRLFPNPQCLQLGLPAGPVD